MQRVAASWGGATIAWVGHASRHRVHVPHWSSDGPSKVSDRLQIISARKIHDPSSGLMTHVFFPIQPRPAYCAQTRSCTGPVSTYASASNGSGEAPPLPAHTAPT